MDLDAFVAAHRGEWIRLEELLHTRRLRAAQADEVLDLYQRAATHLSVIRSAAPDPSLVAYLSVLVSRARSRTAGTRSVSWSDATGFFTDTFPAQLYRTRWWWGVTLVANVVTAFVLGGWFYNHPRAESTLISKQQVDQLVNHDFQGYYSQYAASHFAAQVWTNNAWVAATCIALGVLGFPVILLLFNNILNVAVIGALMIAHGRGELFFGLLLPHGMLELTAVFVAAGTGLKLFWSWIEPGPRSRAQSMAAEGRSAASVALGLVAVLATSGVIEAFVTPSPLPTWARIGIGVLTELAFLTYVFTAGRWAVRRGVSGDVSARDVGDTLPVAG